MHIFEKLVAHSKNSVILTDPNLRITFANQGWVDQTGYSFEESVGNNPMQLLAGSENTSAAYTEIKEKIKLKTSFQLQAKNFKKSGIPYIAHLDITPINSDGFNGWLCISTDITFYQTSLCDTKVLAEKLGSLRDVTTELSHDLRNVIHKISANIEIMQLNHSGFSNCPQFRSVSKLVNYGISMLDELIYFFKMEEEKYETKLTEICLNKFVRNCLKLSLNSYTQHKQNVILDLPKYDVLVLSDKYLLTRIMENILSNAFKYTPTKGNITIKLTTKNKVNILSITDNGIGMDSDLMNRIFTRYVRGENIDNNSHQGFGIGMSIVKKLCDILQIIIEIESEVNMGTSVKLIF
jgi:PAS domain S-box-containing protein